MNGRHLAQILVGAAVAATAVVALFLPVNHDSDNVPRVDHAVLIDTTTTYPDVGDQPALRPACPDHQTVSYRTLYVHDEPLRCNMARHDQLDVRLPWYWAETRMQDVCDHIGARYEPPYTCADADH